MRDIGIDNPERLVGVGLAAGVAAGGIGVISRGEANNGFEHVSDPVAITVAKQLGANPEMAPVVLFSLGISAVIVALSAALLID